MDEIGNVYIRRDQFYFSRATILGKDCSFRTKRGKKYNQSSQIVEDKIYENGKYITFQYWWKLKQDIPDVQSEQNSLWQTDQ